MQQRSVSRRPSGKLRSGRAHDWPDVAYDDYPYEIIWSLQSLTTGAVVAMSGFDAVTALVYLLSQSVGLFLVSNTIKDKFPRN
jgi:hypothetical protein